MSHSEVLGSGFHLSWGAEHSLAHEAQGKAEGVPQRNGSVRKDWERMLSRTCLRSDLVENQSSQAARSQVPSSRAGLTTRGYCKLNTGS